ncbi:retrovirus-related pol polyprotein from transposon TNT 1-94 [Tanacetum coccineum]
MGNLHRINDAIKVTLFDVIRGLKLLTAKDIFWPLSMITPVQVLKVWSDNGTEFKNEKLRSYYEKLGIMHQTSIARTPKQNVSDKHFDEPVQEDIVELDGNTFINPFGTPAFEEAESSSNYQDPSNMHEIYQQHCFTNRWTKNHPIEQVIGDPSKPVTTRSRLHTDAEMRIWIESMQDELNQLKRLDVWELVERPIDRNVIKIDVKTAFLNGPLKEEVFPRAWYDKLYSFLIDHHFTKGVVDPTLFTRRHREDILQVQIYVDDIIFGSKNPVFSKRFAKLIKDNLKMSMMGEMKFFLGLQVHQSPRRIFINQSQYTLEILKKHGMDGCDSISTPMAIDRINADLQGCHGDFKSTFGGIQFLGDKLVIWSSKKQDCTAMSTAEAEFQCTAIQRVRLPYPVIQYNFRILSTSTSNIILLRSMLNKIVMHDDSNKLGTSPQSYLLE